MDGDRAEFSLIKFADWLKENDAPRRDLLSKEGGEIVADYLDWLANQAYGVWENTEKTEGRGMMILTTIFRHKEDADAYVEKQGDYPGHPMYKVKPLTLNLDKIDSPQGWRVPR